MTTPHDLEYAEPIGPDPRPSDEMLAAMATVRIPRQRPPEQRPAAPLLVAALLNTMLAVLICLAVVIGVVLLAVVATGEKLSPAVAQIALGGWLLAHGVPLTTSAGQIGLAPLTVGLLVMWRLSRAGVYTTRGIGARGTGSVRLAFLIAVTIGGTYATLGLLAAILADRPGMTVNPWRALLHFLVVGTVAALIGSIRTTGALGRLARATPMLFRDGIRTGVVATVLLLAAGAGVGGLAVALQGGQATDVIGNLHTGIAGQAGLLLLSLMFAPNMAVWSSSYLLGPGFVFGEGTIVRASEVHVGGLPKLPVFAGIPEGPLHGAGWLLMVLPLAAPIVANVLMVRRRLRPRRTRSGDTVLPRPHWPRMVGSAVVSGPVAGLLFAAAAYVASGPWAKFTVIGPVIWQSALITTGVVIAGSLLGLSSVLVFARR